LCFISKEAMKLPPQVRSSMYRDAFWGGEHHMIPSKACFTEHLNVTTM
jgi:hypothetical protein